MSVTLPADVLTALRVMYSDGAFFSAYHARVGDAATRVTDWDPATRTRTVSFQKRLDIPAPIARVLGARRNAQRPNAAAAVGTSAACTPASARAAALRRMRPARRVLTRRLRPVRPQATSRR